MQIEKMSFSSVSLKPDAVSDDCKLPGRKFKMLALGTSDIFILKIISVTIFTPFTENK